MFAPNTPVGTGCPIRVGEHLHERVEARLRDVRRRRARPRRPIAFARGRVQRELRDGQQRAARVEHRSVHHAGLVVEYPHVGDLSREPFAVVGVSSAAMPTRSSNPAPIRLTTRAIDDDARFAHALREDSHRRVFAGAVGSSRRPDDLALDLDQPAELERQRRDRLRVLRRWQVSPPHRLAAGAASTCPAARSRDHFAFADAGNQELALGGIDRCRRRLADVRERPPARRRRLARFESLAVSALPRAAASAPPTGVGVLNGHHRHRGGIALEIAQLACLPGMDPPGT